MVSLPDVVAQARLQYHLEAIDVNNVLNQLKLRKDEKAEMCAKKHVMTIITDILPRLGYDINQIFHKE